MDALINTYWASVSPPEEYGMRFFPELNKYVSAPVLLGSIAGYLVVMKILHTLMHGRAPFALKNMMRLYNVAQICICSYMTYGLGSLLLTGEKIDLFGVALPNPFGVNLPMNATGEFFVFVHYLSKFLDFFDTIFIILRQKKQQLSFLHIYHHATIGPIWGLLLLLGYGGGTACFGAWINSFVHVLMYTHYLVTSFGIQNPFKKALTAFQIMQFYACIAHAVLIAVFPVEIVFPRALAFLQLAYHTSMIILFSSFFKRQFGEKKKPVADSLKSNGGSTSSTPKKNASDLRKRRAM